MFWVTSLVISERIYLKRYRLEVDTKAEIQKLLFFFIPVNGLAYHIKTKWLHLYNLKALISQIIYILIEKTQKPLF